MAFPGHAGRRWPLTRRRSFARMRGTSIMSLLTSVLASDPMLDTNDWWWKVLALVAVKVVAIFIIGLIGTMLMVWFERKIVSGMQNRIGPNKAGPFGLLQTLADGTKLFFKEDLIPDQADKRVFKLAPFLAFVPAFLLWAVIPLGGDFTDGNDGTVTWFGETTRLQLIDPPVGILIVLALSSIGVYGIMLAGWASGSKYPLLGSVRASAQMISYEAALGLSLGAVLLMAGTLSTSGIVAAQADLTDWHLISTGFIPFFIFMIAMTAELNRPPFDLVEAEQELVGGFNTEYSSIRFALFFLAEFMNVITMSAIMVTLFLGGPQPLRIVDVDIFGWAGVFGGTFWVILKTLAFLYAYVWFRATLPRLRYDQLMNLGWKVLIPVALGWFLVLAALQLGRDRDWNAVAVVIISLGALGAAYLLMTAALTVSRINREREGAAY
jgi:NADH-quinone oxidoreductase subunit H